MSIRNTFSNVNKINTNEETVNPKAKAKVKEKAKEEWVWFEGYKGTDKDMKCYDGYQYRLGEQFDIPDGEEIEECKNGFHLCPTLNDVFKYYDFKDNNRFFKVKALVRKEDIIKINDPIGLLGVSSFYFTRTDKLVAKSIIFIEEVSLDELCKTLNISDWSDEYKEMAHSIGVAKVRLIVERGKLTALGYSEAFAKLVVDKDLYSKAYAFGTQEGLSMDMKVWAIFNSK